MSTSEIARTVERYHRAVDAFVNGDAGPEKELYSRRDDATLANPLGPPVRGWDQVEPALDHAAALARDGDAVHFERIADHATPELAYILEIERVRMRIGGTAERMPVALRVTTIFRHETDGWRILHRHADPITAPRAPESIIEAETRPAGRGPGQEASRPGGRAWGR